MINPVARGLGEASHRPVGLRSGPEARDWVVSGVPCWLGLRLLRSRTGINPLTTGGVVIQRYRVGFIASRLTPTGAFGESGRSAGDSSRASPLPHL